MLLHFVQGSNSESSEEDQLSDSPQNSSFEGSQNLQENSDEDSYHSSPVSYRSSSRRINSTSESSIGQNSDSSPSPGRDRDLINRRRLSSRSTRSSNSSRSRSRSLPLSENLENSDSENSRPPSLRRSITRSPSSDLASSSNLDSSFERQNHSPSSAHLSSGLSNSDSDSDTEIYNASEEMNNAEIPGEQVNPEADDDVILIPQEIETIDLCTQAAPIAPRVPVLNNADEVIVINDSPASQIAYQRNANRLNRRRDAGPYHRGNLSSNLLSESMNDSQLSQVKIKCPICLEGAVMKEPQSTICGHIFCKSCLERSLSNEKKCPVCKKPLKTRRDYHNIYI